MAAWDEVAMPVLRWIGEHEADGTVKIGHLADELGLDPLAVANELDRLVGAAFVAGEVRKVMSGNNARPWSLYPVHLMERGARAVGMWPSGQIPNARAGSPGR